jgi:hypothetical protein
MASEEESTMLAGHWAASKATLLRAVSVITVRVCSPLPSKSGSE